MEKKRTFRKKIIPSHKSRLLQKVRNYPEAKKKAIREGFTGWGE